MKNKSENIKYSLTKGQRFWLPLTWIMWFLTDRNLRKSWHLVKKGMEKHEHKFTIPVVHSGYTFFQCEHEGCTLCDDPSLNNKL